MALRDQPYLPLYVQDYLTDEQLNICSWSTQGIYIKILCILHKQKEYGTILFKQTDKQNLSTCLDFASVLIRLLPCQLDEMVKALTELLDNGVLMIEGNKLYQKRMVKDGRTSIARSIAGKSGGGNPILLKQKDKQIIKQNTENENEYEYVNNTDVLNNNKVDFEKLKNSQYTEMIYRAKVTSHNKKLSYEKFVKMIDEFILTQTANNRVYKNENDMKDHFTNWVTIQIDKIKVEPKATCY